MRTGTNKATPITIGDELVLLGDATRFGLNDLRYRFQVTIRLRVKKV